MISHALTIVVNELIRHLSSVYGPSTGGPPVVLGNIAEGPSGAASGGNGSSREVLIVSMVNLVEEKALKNVSHQVRNDTTLRVSYENPPVYVSPQILVAAPHTTYASALLMLSRAIRFFQARNIFTQDNVDPASLTTNAPTNPLDQLETFKLIFDLCSPSLEQINHLWGTLGGKQYPFVLYNLRLLELKYRAAFDERGVITKIDTAFVHKPAVGT